MEFSRRKLPKEAADKLKMCPIDTIQPYAMMLAPVYAYMKANEKFVSVRAPLDFFTPAELTKFRSFEFLYFPEFLESVLPFREAARSVQSMLTWKPELGWRTDKKDVIALSPAPHELSDGVLRILGPLWTQQASIEPFFVSVFVNELCALLPSDLLVEARERDIAVYENSIFGSSWAVFLALHIGYTEIGFLNRLRLQVFSELSRGITPVCEFSPVGELLKNAKSALLENRIQAISAKSFDFYHDRVSQKVSSRLKRIQVELVQDGSMAATIFGERGFVDV